MEPTQSNPSVRSHSRGQYAASVVANQPLCREHYRLTLRVPGFPSARPGQFVQLLCRHSAADLEREPDRGSTDRNHAWSDDLKGPTAFLRRPFSLAACRTDAAGAEIELIHRAVGVATYWLRDLKSADAVSLIGPLGNTFTLPRPDQPALLVGGGVGIPPMLFLAEHLAGRPAVAFCGTLNRDLLPLTVRSEVPPLDAITFSPSLAIDEFARHGIPTVVSTDDGSLGYRGYITQALEQYLDNLPDADPPPVLYTCGPEPMMRRVADIALSRGLECQVAAERAMACGMGTCQSCCIRVRKPDPSMPPQAGSDWCYRLTCTDGPVFQASELLW